MGGKDGYGGGRDHFQTEIVYLHAIYEVLGKVMFSQVFVCVHWGLPLERGGLPLEGEGLSLEGEV